MVIISSSPTANWEHVVPRHNFLDARNAWNSASGAFPADLNRMCLIARSNAMSRNGWTSLPDLTQISIGEIGVLDSQDPSSPPVFRTAVAFHFRESGKSNVQLNTNRPIVMLLDGTIATLRLKGKQ